MRKGLAVHVPAPERDNPGWAKVGIIAAIGFVVGVAWPRVVGVRLGPSAPGEAAAAAAAAASASSAGSASSASSDGKRVAEAPPASVSAKAAAPPASIAASSAGAGVAPFVTVQRGVVVSCKTEGGESKKGAKECGSVPALDLVVGPRVRKISSCSGLEGQTGKLSVIANADFASGRFWYELGKSSTVPNVESVQSCLKTALHGVTVNNVTHEHPRYTVAYSVVLAPGSADSKSDKTDKSDKADKTELAAQEKGDKPEKADRHEKAKKGDGDDKPEPTPIASGGEGQVAWEVALVRDVPKTGSVVARLPRGAKVKVGATKDGWYAIKYGDDFASEGFVYRGAIGK